MARRDRVPRHKSRDRNRNKNAKLSPFQREQKRTKLANQVPTASTIGGYDNIPHSQRHVFNYLQEKMQRQKAKREALELERQEALDAAAPASGSSAEVAAAPKKADASTATRREKKTGLVDKMDAAAAAAQSSSTSTSKKSAKPQMNFASLNAELSATVGAALKPLVPRDAAADTDAPRTVEEIIARKKERKHKRKQEARRQRVAAELQEMEVELDDYAKNTLGKAKAARKKARGESNGEGETAEERRERVNVAFDRQLRAMEKEKATAAAAEARAATAAQATANTTSRKRHRGDDNDNNEGSGSATTDTSLTRAESAEEEAAPRQRKRISFDPAVADPSAAQSARRTAKEKKPHDFYDLVDVVRYGERVEAPPVFDVVPNRNAAVSRLANQLEKEALGTRGRRGAAGLQGTDERHRLLSGAGQLGQQKRLARLGLAPAITHTVQPDGSAAAAAARMSKAEEIQALRDRVLATYQRNRKKEVAVRKGVDMHHEFPKFA